MGGRGWWDSVNLSEFWLILAITLYSPRFILRPLYLAGESKLAGFSVSFGGGPFDFDFLILVLTLTLILALTF